MSSPHRFVVRRQEWTPPDPAGVQRLLPEKWTRVVECRTAHDAAAKCALLATEARRTLNPFHLGGPSLFYQTSLPPFALHDYLLDHGLTPPANSLSSIPNYAFWWVKNNRVFSDDQRAAVWAACDKLTLFDVVEVDDREAARVVVENMWSEYGLRLGLEGEEGGWPVAAFRRSRDARRDHLRREEGRRAPADEVQSEWSDDSEEAGEASHAFHVQTVPLVGAGGGCHIVVRQGFTRSGGYILHSEEAVCQWNLGARVPLVAFSDHSVAADHLRHLTRRARRSVNPFAVVWRASDGYMFEQHPLFENSDAASHGLPNGLTLYDASEAVRKLALTPPAPDMFFSTAEWVAWYDRVVQWSPEYVDAIWGTFADFLLFEVVEVTLE